MKNLNLLKPLFLFVFLGLCSTACNDDDGQIPMPNPEVTCRLISSNFADSIEYNAEGYVTKMTSFYTNSDILTETYKFIYNDANLVVREELYLDDYLFGDYLASYTTYAYSDGLRTSSTTFSSEGERRSIKTFEYDNKKRLIKSISFIRPIEEGSHSTTIYAYDSNDDVIKVEMLYANRSDLITPPDFITTYEDYDNHPAPLSTVKGWPGIEGYRGLSKHNPGKTTYMVDSNDDGIIQPGEEKGVATYHYVYNSEGYPTKITLGDNDETFAYQCE